MVNCLNFLRAKVVLYFTLYLTRTFFFQGNHNKDSIAQRIQGLQEKLSSLDEAAALRKAGLIDNSAFLQFIWKTDVVESWIKDKENQVRSDDYGRDLSSVQTLLTKQVGFTCFARKT